MDQPLLALPAGAAIAEVLASTAPLRPMDGTLAPDEGLVLRIAIDRLHTAAQES